MYVLKAVSYNVVYLTAVSLWLVTIQGKQLLN